MKNEPMYINVYRVLSKRIEAGVFKVGDLLPSEPELQKEFQVSRTTIRKAMETLTQNNYVSIKQGRGTTVLDKKEMTQQLNYVSSFTQTLEAKGCKVELEGIVFDIIAADETLANDLEVKTGDEIFFLKRIIHSNGTPLAISLNYLVPRFVPRLPDDYKEIVSLYQYLEDKWGITISTAIDRISAKAANSTEAKELNLKKGDPLLVNNRIAHTMGTPFEAVTSIIDAKAYEFCVSLKGRMI